MVLAAGASSRMGAPKAGLRYGGRAALARILATCRQLELAPAVVVAGAHPEAVDAAREGEAAQVVVHPGWAAGRTTSIQAGLAALSPDAAGALLWPVDACLVDAATVEALLAAWCDEPRSLACVPSHQGRRGHPLLLDREALPRLTALGPDAPARDVVRALAAEGRLLHVVTEDAAVLMDADTPADHARWEAWLARAEGRGG